MQISLDSACLLLLAHKKHCRSDQLYHKCKTCQTTAWWHRLKFEKKWNATFGPTYQPQRHSKDPRLLSLDNTMHLSLTLSSAPVSSLLLSYLLACALCFLYLPLWGPSLSLHLFAPHPSLPSSPFAVLTFPSWWLACQDWHRYPVPVLFGPVGESVCTVDQDDGQRCHLRRESCCPVRRREGSMPTVLMMLLPSSFNVQFDLHFN